MLAPSEQKYTYADMKHQLDLILSKFGLNSSCDVFEETLLKMAGITSVPTACQFSENKSTRGQHTNFYLGITPADADRFVSYFKTHYNDQDIVIHLKGENTIRINGYSTIFIRLNSHILTTKVLPDFNEKLISMSLKSPEIIEKYARQCHSDKPVSYKEVFQPLIKIGNVMGLSAEKTDFIEETYLRMANVKSQPSTCRFTENSNNKVTTNFYLGISIEEAEVFRDFFNKSKPDSATILGMNVTLPDKGQNLLQQISVKNNVLKELTLTFIATLKTRMEKEPDAIETYRKQSGLLRHTSKEVIVILDSIFKKLLEKLPQRKSTCYLDEDSTKKAPAVHSLIETIYRSGVLAGNENVVVENSKLFKEGQVGKYQINFTSLNHASGKNDQFELEEMRPDKDGAATLKLAHAVYSFRQAIAKSLPSTEILQASEKLTQAIYFYGYACNSAAERAQFKQAMKQDLKNCQKQITKIQEGLNNPKVWVISEPTTPPPDSYNFNSFGSVMRC